MKQWCYAISSSFVQPYVKPLLQINENKQQQKNRKLIQSRAVLMLSSFFPPHRALCTQFYSNHCFAKRYHLVHLID